MLSDEKRIKNNGNIADNETALISRYRNINLNNDPAKRIYLFMDSLLSRKILSAVV